MRDVIIICGLVRDWCVRCMVFEYGSQCMVFHKFVVIERLFRHWR